MLDMKAERKGHGVTRLRKALPKTANYIAAAIGEKYAQFVRENYLSGQRLRSRRGITRASVKFFKERRGIFGVRPGVGVRGRLNYLLRFERGTSRAFMRPSWRAFKASKRHHRIARETIGKLLEKFHV